ncbi:MAG: GFA family protein, partial [Siculibacillus sp.]|nr:GFA family protein [Siculibacillus sp.]
MAEPTIAGGCLCGRVRYTLAVRPDDVAHCHCRICRRAAGAPFVTWATVARTDLAVAGEICWFRSSTLARRGFCPTCGTQLFFAQEIAAEAVAATLPLADAPPADPHGAATIDVTAASLDAPDAVVPVRNIWTGSRLAFLHGFDASLPDHLDEGTG